mmetsp:Transcript_24452/g.59872  ORF Transcript_24452/g.59872 Transcript_24452/m.59872 type:complete len:87 (+) Transcript_24452:14-274(+)
MSHTSHTTTPSSAQPVSIKQALMTQARMGQLLDEEDHKRCSEGNHRALLSENLDQLRSLVTTLKAEDWMFSASSQTSEPAYWAASR